MQSGASGQCGWLAEEIAVSTPGQTTAGGPVITEGSVPFVGAIQPFVHGLVSTVRAPSVTISGGDGQVRLSGASGFFLGDRRMLAEFRVSAFEREPEVLHTRELPGGRFVATAVIRDGSEPTPDPTLLLTRERVQTAVGFDETWTVRNLGLDRRAVHLSLHLATDFADTSSVKSGHALPMVAPHADSGDATWSANAAGASVVVSASLPPTSSGTGRALGWSLSVGPAQVISFVVAVVADQAADGAFRPSAGHATWNTPQTVSSDVRYNALVQWGFDDMAQLMLADPDEPMDGFVAAGSPWFFTLFGRDSLWSALLMLPFGADLAWSTLRVLARRQGTTVDERAAEQPGRVLHEARAGVTDNGLISLPSLYYGSIDATPLWIITLVEAWRWSGDDASARELIPALQAACRWLIEDSDADGDGLMEYIDHTGLGLANQGWKDSGDSVSWKAGALAEPPIALAEVQGYGFRAALDAAELLDTFELPGAEELRLFAQRIHEAFHSRFWLEDEVGAYVAVALDTDKQAVDSVSSNAGHLLATGLLDADQEAVVIARLLRDLACPAGLRTLATSSARYSPVSYHNGSIWPHDNSIIARAMVLAGHPEAAATLLRGLLVAVETFGGRLPELYGYDDAHNCVVPYPASCRPQAWAAAASAVAVWAVAPIAPCKDGSVVALAAAPVLADAQIVVDGLVCRGVRWRATAADGVVVLDPSPAGAQV